MGRINNVKRMFINLNRAKILNYIGNYTTLIHLEIMFHDGIINFNFFEKLINLEDIRIICNIGDLELDGEIINLKCINNFKKLKQLHLKGCKFEIEDIENLTQLEILSLHLCNIQDEDIYKLSKLTNLIIFNMSNNKIRINVDFIINNFTKLEVLDISYTGINPNDYIKFKKLTTLKALIYEGMIDHNYEMYIEEELENELTIDLYSNEYDNVFIDIIEYYDKYNKYVSCCKYNKYVSCCK